MTAREAQKGRAVGQLTGSLASLFLVAIILMVNYLAYRHYQRFDWTSQSLFTLSEKSKQVLRKLDNDVDIYVFMSRNEPSAQQTDELLKRYGAVTQHLRVHHVDPDRQAAEFKLLAQRFGVASGEIESGTAIADVAAVVAFGAKNWHIKREDLSALDMGPAEGEGGGTEQVSVKIEQSFTGAIVQVTSGRPTHVCVTAGHGEWTLEEAGDRSLSSFKATLRHDNIEWQGFETLGKTSVPKECDAVFVLGPLRAFSSAESKLLFDYLRAGGNLWLALDPVIELDQVAPTGFEDPLRELGINLDRSLALELSQDHLLSPNASEFVVTEFGDHVTTRPLQHAARILVTLARTVSAQPEHANLDILLRTSEKGFGKTTISEIKSGAELKPGPGDIPAPASLAIAARVGKHADDGTAESTPGGHLIVVGDSDILQPPLLDSAELANSYLVSAWTGWLTQRPALIAIPPKKVKTGNIVFTQDDLAALRFRVAVLIPAAAFILGFAVWLNRRA